MENEKKNQEQPETDSSMSPAHERIKLLANSIKEDSLKKDQLTNEQKPQKEEEETGLPDSGKLLINYVPILNLPSRILLCLIFLRHVFRRFNDALSYSNLIGN